MSTTTLSGSLITGGQADARSAASLIDLEPGQSGTVCAVPSVDLLPALGVRRGKHLRVVARSIAGGPIVVLVDRRTIAVDRAIAGQIALCLGE